MKVLVNSPEAKPKENIAEMRLLAKVAELEAKILELTKGSIEPVKESHVEKPSETTTGFVVNNNKIEPVKDKKPAEETPKRKYTKHK